MSSERTQAWLAEWQARFGAILRTPLATATGTFRADPSRYAAASCAEVRARPGQATSAGLAVYNRQYWFRLFTVLQNELPLAAQLCGLWTFNRYAQAYLAAYPPQHADIQRVAEHFELFVAGHLPGRSRCVPRAALLEAIRLDTAFSRVFFAPDETPLTASAWSAGEPAQLCLRARSAYARVVQHWPLVQMRQRLLADRAESGHDAEAALPLPAALVGPQHWVLVRNASGVLYLLLEPQQARLLALLETHALGEALGRLEAECTPEERELLPQQIERWLAQAVKHGFWRAGP